MNLHPSSSPRRSAYWLGRSIIAALAAIAVAAAAQAQTWTPGTDLATVSPKASPPHAEATVRPWSLAIRTFAGYNDNVTLVPDETLAVGDKASPWFGLTAVADDRIISDGPWVVAANLRGDLTTFTRTTEPRSPDITSDPSDLSLTSVQAGLRARRFFTAGNEPASIGASYQYRHDSTRDENPFGHWHTLLLDAQWQVQPGIGLGVHYQLQHQTINVVFPDPALNDRSSKIQSVGVVATARFGGGRSLTAGYDYVDDEASGRNFRNHAHVIKARYDSRLAGPVWMTLEATLAHETYPGFDSPFIPPPGRKRQDVLTEFIQLVWALNPHWSLDIFYERADWRSNSRWFQASRNTLGAGATFHF